MPLNSILTPALTNTELYPESIPDLLHQDLAYLWILGLPPATRPLTWADPIAAWKELLTVFLMSATKGETLSAHGVPLGAFLKEAGLPEDIEGLSLGKDGIVGCLSSTVVVRPLPLLFTDAGSARRAALREVARGFESHPHLGFFVAQLQQSLQQAGGEVSAACAKAIGTEFERVLRNAPDAAPGRWTKIHLFSDLQDGALVSLDVLERSDGAGNSFLRCKKCGTPLTVGPNDPPVRASGTSISMPCPMVQCGQTNDVDLGLLRLWVRPSRGEVFFWDDLRSWVPEVGPPRPSIAGDVVSFRWDPGTLGGQASRCELRIQFAGAPRIAVQPLEEILYTDLLLPEGDDLAGLVPVKLEWLDALGSCEMRPFQGTSSQRIQTSLTLEGLKGAAGDLRVKREFEVPERVAGTSVGIFPRRDCVVSGWKKFITFRHGADAGSHSLRLEVRTPDGKPARVLGPDGPAEVLRSSAGFPEGISLVDSDKASEGITMDCRARRQPPAGGARITLGIDFGTSNSLVYWAPDGDKHAESVQKNGLRPSDLSTTVDWLFGRAPDAAETIAGCLPGPTFGKATDDPYLIPSALWRRSADETLLPRLSSVPPDASGPAFVPVKAWEGSTGFKWDEPGRPSRTHERLAYLEWLAFWAIPLIGARLRSPVSEVTLGMNFPLAFPPPMRKTFRQDLETFRQNIAEFGSPGAITASPVFTVDESTACVEALGIPAVGQTFLVADMGGGSLDLALFQMRDDKGDLRAEFKQIGSLRYAGETFLDRSVDDSVSDPWQLRDMVRQPGQNPALMSRGKLFRRFATLALEFLRTCAMAHKTTDPGATGIKLLLVGNGWRLAWVVSKHSDEEAPFLDDYYRKFLESMGEGHLMYLDEADLEDFRRAHGTTKHLAVVGALNNALSSQPRKMLDARGRVGLPCGRDVSLGQGRSVRWSDLVGDGQSIQGSLPNPGELEIEMELPPDFDRNWESELRSALGVSEGDPLPTWTKPRMREALFGELDREPALTMRRGPLQLLLEQYWVTRLSSREAN